jgi:hypothetical protein
MDTGRVGIRVSVRSNSGEPLYAYCDNSVRGTPFHPLTTVSLQCVRARGQSMVAPTDRHSPCSEKPTFVIKWRRQWHPFSSPLCSEPHAYRWKGATAIKVPVFRIRRYRCRTPTDPLAVEASRYPPRPNRQVRRPVMRSPVVEQPPLPRPAGGRQTDPGNAPCLASARQHAQAKRRGHFPAVRSGATRGNPSR